jgi:hypothetical protein
LIRICVFETARDAKKVVLDRVHGGDYRSPRRGGKAEFDKFDEPGPLSRGTARVGGLHDAILNAQDAQLPTPVIIFQVLARKETLESTPEHELR